jgi:hypothetical protein
LERRREGGAREKGRMEQTLNIVWRLGLLGAVFMSEWGKNYTTSNVSFTSKSFWKSSQSSEASRPVLHTLILNHAFICLPIKTDANCP